jgi:hypothetical protein
VSGRQSARSTQETTLLGPLTIPDGAAQAAYRSVRRVVLGWTPWGFALEISGSPGCRAIGEGAVSPAGE